MPAEKSSCGAILVAGPDDAGACLRVLKLEMNSSACAESPNRFFKCSAAASLGSDSEYAMTSLSESSSKGNNRDSCGIAHFWRAMGGR